MSRPVLTGAAAAAVDAAAGAAAAAAAAATAAAAAVGGVSSTAASVGRGGANTAAGTFHSAVSETRFKCMYNSGGHSSVCGEGRDYRNLAQRGPWHAGGTVRVAFFNQKRGEFDGFCPAHADKVGEHYADAMREWKALSPQLPRRAGKSKGKGKRKVGLGWAAAGGGGGSAAAGGGSGSASAAGVGQSSRQRRINADDAFKASQRAQLAMSFPNESARSDNDGDLSTRLDMRQQRHEEMKKEDVDDMVFKIATERVKGMPIPQEDGSLSRTPPGSAWSAVDKGALPRISLASPMNRADRLVSEERGGTLSDAAKNNILLGFQCIGTVVVFAPEVSKCEV